MVLLSSFDRVLLVGFLVTAGIILIFASGVIPANTPYHPISSVAGLDGNSIATSGVIDAKYGGTGVSSCTDGNVLKWSAAQSKWVCGFDVGTGVGGTGTVTSVTAGTGLTGVPNPITVSGQIDVNSSYVQRRVSTACAVGSAIRSIDAVGGVVCQPVSGSAGVTSVTAGLGLTGTPNPVIATGTLDVNSSYVQRRVSTSCAAGSAIRSIDAVGGVVCEPTGGSVVGGPGTIVYITPEVLANASVVKTGTWTLWNLTRVPTTASGALVWAKWTVGSPQNAVGAINVRKPTTGSTIPLLAHSSYGTSDGVSTSGFAMVPTTNGDFEYQVTSFETGSLELIVYGYYVDGTADLDGDVNRITAGTGITISPTSGQGNVTVTNSGVTQIVQGTNISISPVGGTGAVTVSSDEASSCSVIDTGRLSGSTPDYSWTGYLAVSMMVRGRNICMDNYGCTYRIWQYNATYPAGSNLYQTYAVPFKQVLFSSQYHWHDAKGDQTGINADGVDKALFTGWASGGNLWDDAPTGTITETDAANQLVFRDNAAGAAYVIAICDQ